MCFLGCFPLCQVRDQRDFPRKNETTCPIKPGQPRGMALSFFKFLSWIPYVSVIKRKDRGLLVKSTEEKHTILQFVKWNGIAKLRPTGLTDQSGAEVVPKNWNGLFHLITSTVLVSGLLCTTWKHFISTVMKFSKKKFNPTYKCCKNNLLKVSQPIRRQNVRNEPHL